MGVDLRGALEHPNRRSPPRLHPVPRCADTRWDIPDLAGPSAQTYTQVVSVFVYVYVYIYV